jgi:hypothetical protein
MQLSDVYCHRVDVAPRDAARMQESVAYVFTHFTEDTAAMRRTLEHVKRFFCKHTGIEGIAGVEDACGITTASMALDVRTADAVSTSPDDTRVGFILGKPTRVLRKGFAVDATERRYIVLMRISDRAAVHMSKLHVMPRKTIFSAKGMARADAVKAEGAVVTMPSSCCGVLEDAAREGAERLCVHGAAAMESVVLAMQRVLGVSDDLELPKVRRMHTMDHIIFPPVQRMDTAQVDGAASAVAVTVGACAEPVRPRRQ